MAAKGSTRVRIAGMARSYKELLHATGKWGIATEKLPTLLLLTERAKPAAPHLDLDQPTDLDKRAEGRVITRGGYRPSRALPDNASD